MVDLRKEIKLSDLIPKRPGPKPGRAKAVTAPKRRSMPPELVGLKIEAASLTAAQIVNNGSKRVVKVAYAPLAAGIVNGGEVRDPAALAAALGDFFKQNDLPRRGIRLGLANTRIGVRVIELSGVTDGRQLENAIGFKAHEILAAPLDEAVLDYHLLDASTSEDGTVNQRVLLVIVYRDSIDRYLAATDAASLELSGIDLDAFALLRASTPPHEAGTEPGTAVVAVSIDHDLTTLAISDGTICHFTRILEWGTANVDSALARALKVTPAEAGEARRKLTLGVRGGQPPAIGAVSPEDVVRRELGTLVRELQSSIRFFASQPGAPSVDGLLVSGPLAELPGFTKRLGDELGLAASAADPFARVELGPGVERPERVGGLVVAVGLGIEDA